MRITCHDRRALTVRHTGWRASLARLLRRPVPTYESAFSGTAIVETDRPGAWIARLSVSEDQLPVLLVYPAEVPPATGGFMVEASIEEVRLP